MMKNFKIKKHIAIIMSVAILVASLPLSMFTFADTDLNKQIAEALGATLSETPTVHDTYTDASYNGFFTVSNSWGYPDSGDKGTEGSYLLVWPDGTATLKGTLPCANYIANLTFYYNPDTGKDQGLKYNAGTFGSSGKIIVRSKDGGEIASSVALGAHNREQTTDVAKNQLRISGTTSSEMAFPLATDTNTKVALTIASYNGTTYYYVGNEKIGEVGQNATMSGDTELEIALDYMAVYISKFDVYTLSTPVEETPLNEQIAAELGATLSDTPTVHDTYSGNNGADNTGSWTVSGIGTGCYVENRPIENSLLVYNNSGATTMSATLPTENYIANLTFYYNPDAGKGNGTAYNDGTFATSGHFVLNTKDNDAVVSYVALGAHERDNNKIPSANQLLISGTTTTSMDFTLSSTDLTEVALTVVSYKGTTYYYVGNTEIGQVGQTAQMSGETVLEIVLDYMAVYISKFDVYGITPPPTSNELIADELNAAIAETPAISENYAGTLGERYNNEYCWTIDNSYGYYDGRDVADSLLVYNNNSTATMSATVPYADYIANLTFYYIPDGGTTNYPNTGTFASTGAFTLSTVDDGKATSTLALGAHLRGQDNPKANQFIIENTDTTKDFPLAASGLTEVALTVVSYQGTTYYYVGGTKIGSVAQSAAMSGETVLQATLGWMGIYLSSFEVSALTDKFDASVEAGIEERGLNAVLGDTLYKLNLAELNAGSSYADAGLQSGGTNSGHIVWSSNVSGVKVVSDPKKALAVYNNNGAFVGTPRLDTKNYVAQATIYYKNYGTDANAPYFSVFNNIKDDSSLAAAGQESAGLYFSAPDNTVADATANSFKLINRSREGSYYGITGDLKFSDYNGGAELTNGTEFTVTIYSYEGMNYYYINGNYVGYQGHVFHENEGDIVGFASYKAGVLVTNFTVKELLDNDAPAPATSAIDVVDASVGYADRIGKSDAGAAALKLGVSALDTSHKHYSESAEYGLIVKMASTSDYGNFTVDAAGVMKPTLDENGEVVIEGLADMLDTFIFCRAYIKHGNNYYYSPVKTYTPAFAADEACTDAEGNVKDKLDSVYGDANGYVGSDAQRIDLTVFSDMHYTPGYYISSIADLQTIIQRAKDNGSNMLINGGDLSNGYRAEVHNALNNSGLNYYGVYGNHELEGVDSDGDGTKDRTTTMNMVTPALTNSNTVVWGTEDGKMDAASQVGYYYQDVDMNNDGRTDFRFVFLDTNWSWNLQTNSWEHNKDWSYGAPTGNIRTNSLGDTQMKWLEKVLTEAAEQGISAITVSHCDEADSFNAYNSDGGEVRGIYSRVNKIRKGTVVAAINGHHHTNNQKVIEDVLYVDINTVRNVWNEDSNIYSIDNTDDAMYVDYVEYDSDGNKKVFDSTSLVNKYGEAAIKTTNDPYVVKRHIATFGYSASDGNGSYVFCKDAMSCNISISQTGRVVLEGMTTGWFAGIEPTEELKTGKMCKISSGVYENGVWTEQQ